jgi:hypothetical protein
MRLPSYPRLPTGIAIVALVATLAAALVACTSTKKGNGSATSGASTTSASNATTATTETSAATTSSAPRNLTSQLLTVADLPTGWAIDNSADTNDTTTPPCLASVKTRVEPPSKADQDFVKGTDFPALSQHIGFFGSPATATSTFDELSSILDACKDVSFTSDGTKITGSIGEMSFAKLGDQSEAWQMVLSAEGQTIGIDLALARKGPELELLLYGNYGTPDVGEFVSLATKAMSKVPAS